MNAPPSQRTCLITGSRGYLGSCVKDKFQQAGWNVVELTRNPEAESVRAGRAVPFQLGADVSAQSLRGADALVHCAHDFSLRHWDKMHAVNVIGAEKLFAAARAANVGRRVFISSMSAFDGCQALYGKAKLEVEQRLSAGDVFILRPGLIYGDHPRAMVGHLVKQVRNSTLQPLFGGGSQVLYLSHQADLAEVIHDHADGRLPVPPGPVSTTHDQGWTFRSILEGLARAQGKQLRFLNVPWRPVWLLLKCAEFARLPLPFRSDSLISLMRQNPHPSFELARRLGLKFRPFEPETLKL